MLTFDVKPPLSGDFIICLKVLTNLGSHYVISISIDHDDSQKNDTHPVHEEYQWHDKYSRV
jgi:hypothetical protein